MPREALLIRTLVELADNLTEDFDVVEVLTMLSGRCVDTLEVTSAGVLLTNQQGKLQVVASSSDTMRVLELLELQADEGPCVDCFHHAMAVVNVDLATAAERWPTFTQRAVAAGFRSVHAVPMRLRGRTIGALGLFRAGEDALDATDLLAAQALADVATITILQRRSLLDARVLNDQLNQALLSRVIIEQAKGRVSEAAGLDMDQAFRRLRGHARSHNIRLTDLCRALVDGSMATTALDPLPTPRH